MTGHKSRSGEVIDRVSPGLSTSSSLRNDAKLNGLCRHRSGAASEITFWMKIWVGLRPKKRKFICKSYDYVIWPRVISLSSYPLHQASRLHIRSSRFFYFTSITTLGMNYGYKSRSKSAASAYRRRGGSYGGYSKKFGAFKKAGRKSTKQQFVAKRLSRRE